jgi:succinoglycan biosynthesis transport protein ExoP
MPVPSPYFITNANPWAGNGGSYSSARHAEHPGPTLREYVHVLRRHWRMVILPCLAALAVTAIVLLLMTPTYTATSTILIERQTPQVLDIKQPGAEDAEGSEEHDFYETQYELLASRSLAAQVISALGLQNNPFFQQPKARARAFSRRNTNPGQQGQFVGVTNGAGRKTLESGVNSQVIDAYLKQLKIEPAPRTRLVTVAFASPDPILSARIVSAHIRAYISKGTELRAEASENAQQFLQTKLIELKARVEQSEAALNSYRRDRGIVGSASDDKTKVVMDRIIDLNRALTAAETQRIALDAQARLTRTRDYKALPEIQNSHIIQALKDEENKVEGEYASLASQYKTDYPPLSELAAKRHSLRNRLNEEMGRVAAGVEWRYAAASEREAELRQEIELEKKQAAMLNQASLQDAILSREVDSNRELYKSVLARMNEMGMAAGISASNVSVVDQAEVPLFPSSPRAMLSLSLVGVLALFCGISGAFLLDHFDDSFESSEEIEYSLKLPSLGSVPDFHKLTRTNYGSGRHLSTRFPHMSNGAGAGASEIAEGMRSFAAAGEAYRAIRIGILLSRADAPPKSILITSGSPKEGKTVTAINLAIAFAKMGSKVLLIDGDLRRPRCHDILGLGHRPGLTEVLTGSAPAEEVITATGVDRLWCLTAGSRPPNPGELLGSAKMAYTILCLRDSYDFIILDSAPVMPVTDTLPLTAVVDGVLLVVGPHTPKEQVRKASARLSQIRTNVLGVVLNQTDVTENDYYYSRASLAYVEATGDGVS